ncbi:MAG: hypothetical protein COA47_06785 [Robiginitomaculum sp.]|nr:MAG: hypothetical protein COA47_06785 [Robiginitomaculum sp.]
MTLSIAFEILVSLLLVITIGYCFVLDQRLKALRSGQDGVRQSIVELISATGQAEHSIRLLKETGTTVSQELEAHILEAKALGQKITARTEPAPRRASARPLGKIPSASIPNLNGSGLMDRLKKTG